VRRKLRAGVAVASLAAAGLGVLLVADGAWIFAKAALAQRLLEHAWQQTLSGEARARPWPWADTWPVARLAFPQHDTTLVVLSGASGRTLAFGPGHTDGSAPPGTHGTSIISGHRDTHFRVLRRLEYGDVVLVERADGLVTQYRVTDRQVVDARTTVLRAAEDPDRATLFLVTCWPFEALSPGGPLRYVVTADHAPGDVRPIDVTALARAAEERLQAPPASNDDGRTVSTPIPKSRAF